MSNNDEFIEIKDVVNLLYSAEGRSELLKQVGQNASERSTNLSSGLNVYNPENQQKQHVINNEEPDQSDNMSTELTFDNNIDTKLEERWESNCIPQENGNNTFRQPDTFLMPTNKVIRNVFDGKTDIFGEKEIDIDINPKKARGKYIVSIQAFLPDSFGTTIPMPRNFNSYDENVLRGIFTLLDNGYTSFTARQVYNAFAGKPAKNHTTVEKVTKSIDKMRMTLISIDWSAHARMRGVIADPDACIVVNENFISADYYSFYLNGQAVKGYKINKLPPLYRYAKISKQLANIDRSLLETPLTGANPIQNTDMNIVLKNEILLRIDTMKKNKNFSRFISFDVLYKLSQVGTHYSQKERLRKTVFSMLDSWKSIGHIMDYYVIKNGTEFSSVEIVID